jgi:hypothetical protein
VLERAVEMIKKKKYVEINKKRTEPRVRDKRLVQMQARICDPSLTLKQRRMILHEVGKWRG